jgi:hypothetical protein
MKSNIGLHSSKLICKRPNFSPCKRFNCTTGDVEGIVQCLQKKAELTVGSSFGSSAIFFKTRRFPPPSHGGFGFIGRISSVFEIQHDLTKEANHVNSKIDL